MKSRMSKYEEKEVSNNLRTSKNKKLYEEVSNVDVDYIDINVNNVLEIEKKDLTTNSRSTYQKRKEFENIVIPTEEKKQYEEMPTRKNRIYDIDEILKRAKEELKDEDKKKHLISTEYNILTKLNLEDIDKRELENEEIKEIVNKTYPKKELKEEDDKDLFYDMFDKKEEVVEETEEEKDKKEKIVEEEQEAEEEVKNTEEPKKEEKESEDEEKENDDDNASETDLFELNSNKSKIAIVFIVILVLIILAVGGYFFFKYFSTL